MSWEGQVVRLSESVDQTTRTIGVVIQIENQAADIAAIDDDRLPTPESTTTAGRSLATFLRSGLFCEVVLEGPEIQDAIVVPRQHAALIARLAARPLTWTDAPTWSGLAPAEFATLQRSRRDSGCSRESK